MWLVAAILDRHILSIFVITESCVSAGRVSLVETEVSGSSLFQVSHVTTMCTHNSKSSPFKKKKK